MRARVVAAGPGAPGWWRRDPGASASASAHGARRRSAPPRSPETSTAGLSPRSPWPYAPHGWPQRCAIGKDPERPTIRGTMPATRPMSPGAYMERVRRPRWCGELQRGECRWSSSPRIAGLVARDGLRAVMQCMRSALGVRRVRGLLFGRVLVPGQPSAQTAEDLRGHPPDRQPRHRVCGVADVEPAQLPLHGEQRRAGQKQP